MIPTHAIIGRVYLVKHFTSGCFYRGILTEIYDDHFVVFLIDNHVKIIVNKEHVREYPNVPEWFTVPRCACPPRGSLSIS